MEGLSVYHIQKIVSKVTYTKFNQNHQSDEKMILSLMLFT
jgi:hypothetical protein